jgi:peroxiredoxin
MRTLLRLLVRLAPVVALASAAAAQIGSPPPEFVAHRWMNSPPLSLEELRGKAVLIEIFRTWEERCATNVPALSAKYDKEQKNGLVVLGVSSEDPDTIAPWMRTHQPTYPIVSLKGTEFEKALGARGDWFPITAVIDPEGSLTFSNGLLEGAAESKLGEALDKATKGALWPKKVDKVLAHLQARAHDKAYAEARKLSASQLGVAERAAVDKLTRFLETNARDLEQEARKLLDAGRVYEAHLLATPIAKSSPPFPNAADAQELVATIEAVPNFKAEVKAGQLFVEAFELEMAQEFPKAVQQYREIAKKYDELKVSTAIAARLADLKKRNLLIYVRDCEECIAAKKACARHAEM